MSITIQPEYDQPVQIGQHSKTAREWIALGAYAGSSQRALRRIEQTLMQRLAANDAADNDWWDGAAMALCLVREERAVIGDKIETSLDLLQQATDDAHAERKCGVEGMPQPAGGHSKSGGSQNSPSSTNPVPEIGLPCQHPASQIRTIGGERDECCICKASRFRLNDMGARGPWLESREPMPVLAVRTVCAACDGCGWTEGGAAMVLGGRCDVCGGTGELPKRCEDCPPVGYPTDATRCTPCPRRTILSQVRGSDAEAIQAFKDRFPAPPNPQAQTMKESPLICSKCQHHPWRAAEGDTCYFKGECDGTYRRIAQSNLAEPKA